MKICVTGANGFLGSALALHLSDTHEVVGLARNHLENPSQQSPFKLESYAVLNAKFLSSFDCLVHAAGLANTKAQWDDLEAANIELSQQIASLCVEAGVKKLIHLSSVKAIGEGDVTATQSPKPETEYGKSKLAAEKTIDSTIQGSPTQAIHIRIPMVYSSLASNNFAKLIQLSRSGIPLPLNALNGTRSYCSTLNLSRFVDCVLEATSLNRTYLVADAEPITLSDLLAKLATAQNRHITNLPAPRKLLHWFLNKISPSLANQLFGHAVVDVSESRASLPNWQPLTTQECIGSLEFGPSDRA